jgi:hypothetical protein
MASENLVVYRLRVKKYLQNLKLYIQQLLNNNSVKKILEKYPELLKNIELYVKDAEEFYRKGDWFSALVAIVYAEGLLDSLKFAGLLKISWPSNKPKLSKIFIVLEECLPSSELLTFFKLLYAISEVNILLLKVSGEFESIYRALRYLDSVEILDTEQKLFEKLKTISRDGIVLVLDYKLWKSIASKLEIPVIYVELEV